MKIGKNLIDAMLKVISPKNFSPLLTRMNYNSNKNVFSGTDSFLLLNFYPNEHLEVDFDFPIAVDQLKCMQKICGKDDSDLNITNIGNENLIQFFGDDSIVYFPLLEVKDYPNTTQPNLFGTELDSIRVLPISKMMTKFIEVCTILGEQGGNAIIKDNVFSYTLQDEFGRYEFVYRRPIDPMNE